MNSSCSINNLVNKLICNWSALLPGHELGDIKEKVFALLEIAGYHVATPRKEPHHQGKEKSVHLNILIRSVINCKIIIWCVWWM